VSLSKHDLRTYRPLPASTFLLDAVASKSEGGDGRHGNFHAEIQDISGPQTVLRSGDKMRLSSQNSLIGSERTGRSRRSSTLQEHLRTFLIELHWTGRPRLEGRESPRSSVEEMTRPLVI